jgi:hypothetical protein
MPRHALVLIALLASLALPATAAAADPDAGCDVVASLQGDDSNPGTAEAPVRTVRHTFELLAPGQTGCLTAGQTFHELVNVNPSGTAEQPLSLRSTAGGRAAFTGQIRVNGSHIRISGLNFLGLGDVAAFAPKTYHLGVDGDDVVLSDLEITSPKGICVDVGGIDAYGGVPGPRADGFVLERSRVHGCGLENDLTGQDSGIHGIYLKNTLGARLSDLFVHDNINRGIQLWPNAEGTLIERVVLEGNGSNLNLGSYAPQNFYSRDTTVRRSVIANSRLRSCDGCDVPPGDTANVLGNFPAGTTDYGNRVVDDCVYQSDPTRNFDGYGFTQSGNRFAMPAYVDRAAGDLRAAPGSGCEGYGPTAEVPAPVAGAPTPDDPDDPDPPGDTTTPGSGTTGAGQPAAPAPTPAAPGPAPAAPSPASAPAPARRALARPVIFSATRTRHGLRVRVRTPGPGLLRVSALRRHHVIAARSVRVRGRSATVVLRVPRRALRLDARFRSRDGRVALAHLRLA